VSDVAVTLEPMSDDAFGVWGDASVRAYAADKIRVGAWPAGEAVARAERSFQELLPDGLGTAGHHVRSIVNDAGDAVGAIWFGPADRPGEGSCFILDLEVREEERGRGYGRAALRALEPIARDLGYDAIGLHVFGDNDVARALYRSAGYVETDVTMRKAL
jgi:ribosomal protein S18 acetylase RimI-like enzyme